MGQSVGGRAGGGGSNPLSRTMINQIIEIILQAFNEVSREVAIKFIIDWHEEDYTKYPYKFWSKVFDEWKSKQE